MTSLSQREGKKQKKCVAIAADDLNIYHMQGRIKL